MRCLRRRRHRGRRGYRGSAASRQSVARSEVAGVRIPLCNRVQQSSPPGTTFVQLAYGKRVSTERGCLWAVALLLSAIRAAIALRVRPATHAQSIVRTDAGDSDIDDPPRSLWRAAVDLTGIATTVPQGITWFGLRHAAATAHQSRMQGADMGDKGGKKDKAKQKQQQLKKHRDDEQRKQDHGVPKVSVPRGQAGAPGPAVPRL